MPATPRALAMFPGQGSQRPGMAVELLARYPQVASGVFALADDVLGLPLMDLCTSGSAAQLARTDVTQPAVVATSLAILEVLRSGGFVPATVAGHSLGEYSALAAAGVLSLASALTLVQRRGQLMAAAAERTPGAMSAVLGLSAKKVELLCRQAYDDNPDSVVEVANYNDSQQTVISGTEAAVATVARQALAAGAQRVVRLDVGAPFHCSLMSGVAADFAAELERHEFRDPGMPVLSPVTGGYIACGEDARELLRRQITAPVRWVDTLRRAVADGHTRLVEVGPGLVLTGFAKSIAPEVPAVGTARAPAIAMLLGAGAAAPPEAIPY